MDYDDDEVVDERPKWKKVLGYTGAGLVAVLFVWVVISSVVLMFSNWFG